MRKYDVEVVVPHDDPLSIRTDGQPRARVTIDDMVFAAYVASVDVYQGFTGDYTETRISLACTGAPAARQPAVPKPSDGPTYVERQRASRKHRTV